MVISNASVSLCAYNSEASPPIIITSLPTEAVAAPARGVGILLVPGKVDH